MNRNLQGTKCKLTLPVLTSLVIIMFFISCSGDGGSESIDPAWEDKIKTILLRSEGWIAEWHCSSNDAIVDLIFEDHGKKFEVNLQSQDKSFKCKRKVTITSDGIEMAGCFANTISLNYDPNDERYPFKGDNGTCDLKLKAK